MDYTTAISKRRRHQKVEYLARLMYRDEETGARKEKSRSATSISEAKRSLKDLEDEFESGGQQAVETDQMTFAELAKHCKETRYCEAQYDSEGRKIIGVRGKDTIDSHIKALEEYFGSDKLRDIRVANLRAYRKHRLFCTNRHKKRLSVATVNRELSAAFVPQFLRGVAIGTVAVVLMIGFAFRSWRLSALALLPTAIGLVWSAGLLCLAHVELDLFAMFAVVTFVGIGVDYGVHLVHRYQELGDAEEATAELGPVILLAGAITVLGYGTLVAGGRDF